MRCYLSWSWSSCLCRWDWSNGWLSSSWRSRRRLSGASLRARSNSMTEGDKNLAIFGGLGFFFVLLLSGYLMT